MTVGETSGVTIEEAQKYAGEDRNELNMVFQFEHVEGQGSDHGKWTTEKYDFQEFKKVMIKWQEELAGKAWNSLFLGNHDQRNFCKNAGNLSSYDAGNSLCLSGRRAWNDQCLFYRA